MKVDEGCANTSIGLVNINYGCVCDHECYEDTNQKKMYSTFKNNDKCQLATMHIYKRKVFATNIEIHQLSLLHKTLRMHKRNTDSLRYVQMSQVKAYTIILDIIR